MSFLNEISEALKNPMVDSTIEFDEAMEADRGLALEIATEAKLKSKGEPALTEEDYEFILGGEDPDEDDPEDEDDDIAIESMLVAIESDSEDFDDDDDEDDDLDDDLDTLLESIGDEDSLVNENNDDDEDEDASESYILTALDSIDNW